MHVNQDRCEGRVTMTRAACFGAILVLLSSGTLGAQVAGPDEPTATPAPAESRVARTRVIGVEEVNLPPDTPLSTDADFKLIPAPGAASSNSYLVVLVSRQILAATAGNPLDLQAKLTYPKFSASPTPAAVATRASELTEADTYKVEQKDRYVTEKYYFPVTRGQREWSFECVGCAATPVLNFYVTLYLDNYIPKKTVRASLTDGSEVSLTASGTKELVFPARGSEVSLKLDDDTRIPLPWKRLTPGDVLFVSLTSGREAPVIPHEDLIKGLEIIRRGYEKYKGQEGKGYKGGGSYDLSPRGEEIVKCVLQFGEDGYIETCEDPVTRIQARFDHGKIIEYRDLKGTLKVVLFEKLKDVDISKDANRIVGLATIGRFVIEGSRPKPSLWKDGVLRKGILVDPKRGRFDVQAESFTEGLYVLTGVREK